MTRMPDSFYAERWDRSNIPIKMRGLTLDDYEPSSGKNIPAFDAAAAFIENFGSHYVSPQRAKEGKLPKDRSLIGRGLLFTGNNGTRKTTLAVSILTEVQYLSPNLNVLYLRFSDWKRYLTNTFAKETTELTEKSKRILAKADLYPLVVLDDIGQEHRTATGFTESELHEFLRRRHEAARPTIVTTNIDPEFMGDVYGKSFDSFRYDAFETHQFWGKDSRKIGN